MKKSFGKILLLLALILSLCLSVCSCSLEGLLGSIQNSDGTSQNGTGNTDNGTNDNGSTDNNNTAGGSTDNSTGSGTGENNGDGGDAGDPNDDGIADEVPVFDFSTVPEFSGSHYAVVNNNIPFFTEKEKKHNISYEIYNDRDELGRCTLAVACIGKDLMPTEPRKSISSVKPTGWVQKDYPKSVVNTIQIYNRSHLIAFQLTGENANWENLITGTPYFNQLGMTEFENMVADYLKEFPKNHVMYRVTPIFEGTNLVASGVLMEGYSVEDDGDGICFNVFMYNVQPGVVIDYATGKSELASSDTGSAGTDAALWQNAVIAVFADPMAFVFKLKYLLTVTKY